MPQESDLQHAAQEVLETTPRRLLKTWQNPELIRRMDQVIIASEGAYADRTEFLAEAIRDRVEAEENAPSEEDSADSAGGSMPVPRAGPNEPAGTLAPEVDHSAAFGDWLEGSPPTLQPLLDASTAFGLHNRDYPTLWGADWIGRLTAEAMQPLPWSPLTEVIIARAWEFAAQLQTADLDRPRGAKVAAGFPTNRKRPEAVSTRFREHFLGFIDRRGARGPLFMFGLAGIDGQEVALSQAGVDLLGKLRNAEFAAGPPFSSDAWSAFASHLAIHAPKELEMWRRVLAIVADEPDRKTLIERCDWWSGNTADTNSMGYMARGREWGLVEVKLQDSHYHLTDRGAAEIRRER